MRAAPFLISIIDVSTRIVKRALLSYAASQKISSADHKAACIFPDTDGSPDAFCRILLYPDAFMLHLVYRVSASFCGHPNAFSVLFGALKCTFPHFWSFQYFPVSPEPVQCILLSSFIIARCPSFVNSPSAP